MAVLGARGAQRLPMTVPAAGPHEVAAGGVLLQRSVGVESVPLPSCARSGWRERVWAAGAALDRASGSATIKSRSERRSALNRPPKAGATPADGGLKVGASSGEHRPPSAVAPPSVRKRVPPSLFDNGEGTAKSQCGRPTASLRRTRSLEVNALENGQQMSVSDASRRRGTVSPMPALQIEAPRRQLLGARSRWRV